MIQKTALSIVFLSILVITGVAIRKIHTYFNNTNTSNIQTDSSKSTTENMYTKTDNTTSEDNSHFDEKTYELITMINLTGMTIEDAVSKISELDSNITIQTDYQYNTEHSIGIVIAQSIVADSSFTKGSVDILTLTVSKGTSPETEANNSTSNSKNTGAPKKSKKNTTTESKYTTIHLD